MNVAPACHSPADRLERYAMGKLSDQESTRIEEHLLICVTCQKRLEEQDEFLSVARTAMAVLAQERSFPESSPRSSQNRSGHRSRFVSDSSQSVA
jgi:anti-sigma factor ChrR (cupin superfamily)